MDKGDGGVAQKGEWKSCPLATAIGGRKRIGKGEKKVEGESVVLPAFIKAVMPQSQYHSLFASSMREV